MFDFAISKHSHLADDYYKRGDCDKIVLLLVVATKINYNLVSLKKYKFWLGGCLHQFSSLFIVLNWR